MASFWYIPAIGLLSYEAYKLYQAATDHDTIAKEQGGGNLNGVTPFIHQNGKYEQRHFIDRTDWVSVEVVGMPDGDEYLYRMNTGELYLTHVDYRTVKPNPSLP